MFDIGWSELLLIGVVALIVIGPKELPGVLRTLGQWMGKVRRMARIPGPVPGGDARSRNGRPEEAGRRSGTVTTSSNFDPLGRRAEGHRSASAKASTVADDAATPPSRRAGPRVTRQRTAAGRRRDAAAAAPNCRCRCRNRRRRRRRRLRRRRAAAPPSAEAGRGRRMTPRGHRGHQGAADGAPDRAALAADQGADRVRA